MVTFLCNTIIMTNTIEQLKSRLRQQIKEEKERMRQVAERRRLDQEEYELFLQKNNGQHYLTDSDEDELENEPEEQISFKDRIRRLLKQSNESETDEDDIDEDNPEIDTDEDEDADEDSPVDECFSLEDIKLLSQIGQLSPSQINVADKDDQIEHADAMLKKIGGLKGFHVKNNNVIAVENADYMINLLRTYLDTVKSGGSLRRQRRVPYVIGTGGRYGRLRVHLPSLLTHGQLKAFDRGKKVMDTVVDGDTIDILTKKFNPMRQYSEKAKQVFKKLTRLSGLPENRLSSKFQFM